MIFLGFLKEPPITMKKSNFQLYLILLMLLFIKYSSLRLIQNHISIQLVKKMAAEVFSCFHVLRIVPCNGMLCNK